MHRANASGMMKTPHPLWDQLRHPRGPLTRALRRAGLTAVGTYGAYLVYGLLRPGLLRGQATAAERAVLLPGDALIADPDWVTDFAIEIAAPPAAVWPWIVQLGYGRAGWYSWYPLDNGGVPSADEIVPELQALATGDVIPDGPRAADGYGIWRVVELQPERALVLRSRRDPVSGLEISLDADPARGSIDCTWCFALAPRPGARTRLHVRVRARSHGELARGVLGRVARAFFGLGDKVMENTMLDGIRARAERKEAA